MQYRKQSLYVAFSISTAMSQQIPSWNFQLNVEIRRKQLKLWSNFDGISLESCLESAQCDISPACHKGITSISPDTTLGKVFIFMSSFDSKLHIKQIFRYATRIDLQWILIMIVSSHAIIVVTNAVVPFFVHIIKHNSNCKNVTCASNKQLFAMPYNYPERANWSFRSH